MNLGRSSGPSGKQVNGRQTKNDLFLREGNVVVTLSPFANYILTKTVLIDVKLIKDKRNLRERNDPPTQVNVLK